MNYNNDRIIITLLACLCMLLSCTSHNIDKANDQTIKGNSNKIPSLIPRDQLPYDAKDWNNVEIDFTYLPENTEESCPMSRDEVMEYVRMESGDTDKASEESLIFFRTAIVGNNFCWLWKYTESDGQLCYVTYWIRSILNREIGLSDNNGLSPEQYILSEYYDEVYW